MAAITYTASSRAPLVTDSPAHTAGSSYSIDIKLQQFIEAIDAPKSQHVSLGATVETVLQRASAVASAVIIWDYTLHADVNEFLYSIAGGEIFTLDPYGTVASADNPSNYVCMNQTFDIQRMSHGSQHWRMVSLTLRPA